MALRVSNLTVAADLARSIGREFAVGGKNSTILECLGAKTVNTASKAVAIANNNTGSGGCVIIMIPYFHTISSDDSTQEKELSALYYQILKVSFLDLVSLGASTISGGKWR